jgi:serine/threonine-protein kinase RsbW
LTTTDRPGRRLYTRWPTAPIFPPLRQAVASYARAAGLTEPRLGDFVTAINEAASDTVDHGGGDVRLWQHDRRLICHLTDTGPGIPQPLRRYRAQRQAVWTGWGLWLCHQLCDTTIETGAAGTTIRLHKLLLSSADFDEFLQYLVGYAAQSVGPDLWCGVTI